MGRKLKTFVTVHERDDDGNPTGQSGTFGPNDQLPGWAVKAITNPDVWADAVKSDEAPAPAGGTPAVPPRGGPGSGAPAWRDYAAAVGVEVDAEASRDDVIAALEKAGKPTE